MIALLVLVGVRPRLAEYRWSSEGPAHRGRRRGFGRPRPGTACSIAEADDGSVVGKDRLVIGVNADQPGVGERKGDRYEGFDIDIAKEIAGRLGVTGSDVTFKRVYSATREKMLQNGEVDLVVASYSVTPNAR